MAVNVLTAQDIVLTKNGVVVGCQQTATLDLTAEELDAVCAASGGWAEFSKGRKSWTMSLDALLREATEADAATNYTFHDAFDDFISPDNVEVSMRIGSFLYAGSAFHNGLGASTSQTDTQTWTTSLRGTGPLTKTPVV
ncbi:phage tail tube protein [Rufibacter soli]